MSSAVAWHSWVGVLLVSPGSGQTRLWTLQSPDNGGTANGGGPGFGDPLDRDCASVENDLNSRFVLSEFAQKVKASDEAIIKKEEEEDGK